VIRSKEVFKAEQEEVMSKKENGKSQKGITRRGFLQLVGVSAVATAATRGLGAEPAAKVMEAAEMAKIKLLVNGRRHSLLVEPRWSLLFVLRERLGLTGTKVGCERGECGACTVLMNGEPRYACMTLAVEAEGKEITTLEGLMTGEELGPVQQAFLEEDGLQCGYCTPGQIMAVEGLLRANTNPSIDQIRHGLSGNLCRCGGYEHAFRAARRAADLRKGKRGAS